MNILVIQNYYLTPPGIFGECVKEERGYLNIVFPDKGDKLPLSSIPFDGLIILGGPMYAEDDVNYPHLKNIVTLIHQFHKEKKPILAICLGAQILARAFGKRVYKHDKFEIGFNPVFPVQIVDSEEPILKGCPEKLYVMQWHFDTFDLPKEATLLMYGENCQNQAYRIGDNIYGFQFHLEVTKEILQTWTGTTDEFVLKNCPNFSKQLTQQMQQYLESSVAFSRNVAHVWLELVKARINS